jgi:hypothetical protein
MDSRYKGFQYITLTHDKHHVDFVTVPWGSRDYSVNCEYAFDLYSAGAHSLSYVFTTPSQGLHRFLDAYLTSL